MELPRQDPDQLLHAIRNDASTKKSGKLKIRFVFFRVCARNSRVFVEFRKFVEAGFLTSLLSIPPIFRNRYECPKIEYKPMWRNGRRKRLKIRFVIFLVCTRNSRVCVEF